MVRERDAEAVDTKFPIQGCGDGLEVCEEGDADLELGEEGEGDRGEAGIVQSAVCVSLVGVVYKMGIWMERGDVVMRKETASLRSQSIAL
jgi:hypothetical protein